MVGRLCRSVHFIGCVLPCRMENISALVRVKNTLYNGCSRQVARDSIHQNAMAVVGIIVNVILKVDTGVDLAVDNFDRIALFGLYSPTNTVDCSSDSMALLWNYYKRILVCPICVKSSDQGIGQTYSRCQKLR